MVIVVVISRIAQNGFQYSGAETEPTQIFLTYAGSFLKKMRTSFFYFIGSKMRKD